MTFALLLSVKVVPGGIIIVMCHFDLGVRVINILGHGDVYSYIYIS